MASSDDQPPTFQNPVVVYTAASNLQAHLIVQMLIENDVEAKAIEDQSGVSLWAMGTITQFHQPQIWVEQSTAKTAASLILNFEQKTQSRNRAAPRFGSRFSRPIASVRHQKRKGRYRTT